MSKINVYSSSASYAIKVFDANSNGLKPDNAILVTTGTEPSNAIQINVGDKKWSSIAVNFGGGSPVPPVPPGPSLPPYTIRLKFKQDTEPYFKKGTGELVDESNNIWDLTYENTNWSMLLYPNRNDLLEVIGANTEGVVDMNNMFRECSSLTSVPLFDTSSVTVIYQMFYNCSSLTSVPLFDTSNVTSINSMFQGCTSLTSVPLFDTSNVTDISNMLSNCTSLTSIPLFNTSKVGKMSYMCDGCVNVEHGALSLYQQASSQENPPWNVFYAFRNCGSNTETGAAELAQIPADWK